MRKSKVFASVMSGVCALSIVVSGTMALTGSMLTKANVFSSAIVPPELVDEYTPKQGNGLVDKNIYVTNNGGDTVYVRVKLEEVLAMGTTVAPVNPVWTTHRPTTTPANCNHVAHNGMFTWGMGDVAIGEDGAHTDTGETGYWMYDVADGYAYWSQPLAAGKSTDKLLDSVTVHKADSETYYYAIRGYMEWVDQDDLEQWLGTGDGTKNDATAIFDAQGNKINQITRTPIANTEIKAVFSGFTKPVNPDDALVKDDAGNYYKNISGYPNLYQEMGTDGKTPGEYTYFANGDINDQYQVQPLPAGATTPWLLKKLVDTGKDVNVSAKYYVVLKNGAYAPVYTPAEGGINWVSCFKCAPPNRIGQTDSCTKTSIVPEVRFQ